MLSDLDYFDDIINLVDELYNTNTINLVDELYNTNTINLVDELYNTNTINFPYVEQNTNTINLSNLEQNTNTINLEQNTNIIDNKKRKSLEVKLIVHDKKRQRQLRINKSSQKTRKKQKIKSALMESYIKSLHINIKELLTSLENVDIKKLVSGIYQMNKGINEYAENLIKELEQI